MSGRPLNIDVIGSSPEKKKCVSKIHQNVISVSYLREHFGYNNLKELVRKNGVVAGGYVSVHKE